MKYRKLIKYWKLYKLTYMYNGEEVTAAEFYRRNKQEYQEVKGKAEAQECV